MKKESLVKISHKQFYRRYPDNESARKQFEEWRWGDTIRCAHCDSTRISVAKNQRMPYRCKDCRKRFSARVGTVMQHSNLSYHVWLEAIYIAATSIKGIQSTKLAHDVGTTQKSAWHLGHRIRKAWERDETILNGIVEVDESYFGGKDKNKPAHKRSGKRGPADKQAVVGMKQRNGDVYAATVPDTTAKTLQSEVAKHIAFGSVVYTDEHHSYNGLDGVYLHESVKHSVGEYVRKQAHTNGVESFWSLLKRGYHGTHHHFSVKHMQRYVGEFAARQSLRKSNTIDIMKVVAQRMVGRNLKYEELTA